MADHGVLSPRKTIGKCLVSSPSGGHVAHVAGLQMTGASACLSISNRRSPQSTHSGARVHHVITCEDARWGSGRSSPQDWIGGDRPIGVRGLQLGCGEAHSFATTNPRSPGMMAFNDDDEDDDVATLRRKLAVLQLRLKNMDERRAPTKVEQHG